MYTYIDAEHGHFTVVLDTPHCPNQTVRDHFSKRTIQRLNYSSKVQLLKGKFSYAK